MGLIGHLLLLPAAPLRFTLWVAEQVADEEEAAELEGEIIEQQAERAQPTDEPEEGARDG